MATTLPSQLQLFVTGAQGSIWTPMLSSPFWIVVNNTLNQNDDAGSKTRKISETVKNKLLEEHEKMPEQRLDSETQSAGIPYVLI